MTKRRVFYSFHYKNDNWRAALVRNIGSIEGNKPATDNDWEEITRGGDAAIKKWIDDQLNGRSCTIVLVGEETANRKWIDYEIKKSWSDKKGLLGIRIHKLKDSNGETSNQGANPFDGFTINSNSQKLSDIVRLYNPSGQTSQEVYKNISDNIDQWIEDAIKIRNQY